MGDLWATYGRFMGDLWTTYGVTYGLFMDDLWLILAAGTSPAQQPATDASLAQQLAPVWPAAGTGHALIRIIISLHESPELVAS